MNDEDCASALSAILSSLEPMIPECLGWSGRLSPLARRGEYDLTPYNVGIRRDTSSDIVKEVVCRG